MRIARTVASCLLAVAVAACSDDAAQSPTAPQPPPNPTPAPSQSRYETELMGGSLAGTFNRTSTLFRGEIRLWWKTKGADGTTWDFEQIRTIEASNSEGRLDTTWSSILTTSTVQPIETCMAQAWAKSLNPEDFLMSIERSGSGLTIVFFDNFVGTHYRFSGSLSGRSVASTLVPTSTSFRMTCTPI